MEHGVHDAPELTDAEELEATGATVVDVVDVEVLVDDGVVLAVDVPVAAAAPATVVVVVDAAVVDVDPVVLDEGVIVVTLDAVFASVVWLARFARATVPTSEPPASHKVATRARRSPLVRGRRALLRSFGEGSSDMVQASASDL
jgi:hypothetical protein